MILTADAIASAIFDRHTMPVKRAVPQRIRERFKKKAAPPTTEHHLSVKEARNLLLQSCAGNTADDETNRELIEKAFKELRVIMTLIGLPKYARLHNKRREKARLEWSNRHYLGVAVYEKDKPWDFREDEAYIKHMRGVFLKELGETATGILRKRRTPKPGPSQN